MLYLCAEHFFNHAKQFKSLEREEEQALAKRMQDGDQDAQNMLFNGNLPFLASFIKKHSAGTPSLELIYQGLALLENALKTFDFQKESIPFSRYLEWKLRQLLAHHIADHSSQT